MLRVRGMRSSLGRNYGFYFLQALLLPVFLSVQMSRKSHRRFPSPNGFATFIPLPPNIPRVYAASVTLAKSCISLQVRLSHLRI
jgi:hypothetical protein